MNNREEYEQEIDLRDLLFHILYRWRRILLAAVLVCGLAVGYAVFSNAASPAEGNPQGEEQQAAEYFSQSFWLQRVILTKIKKEFYQIHPIK